MQILLCCVHASTIHKAQGATLEAVEVHMSTQNIALQPALANVALSRVRIMEQMRVDEADYTRMIAQAARMHFRLRFAAEWELLKGSVRTWKAARQDMDMSASIMEGVWQSVQDERNRLAQVMQDVLTQEEICSLRCLDSMEETVRGEVAMTLEVGAAPDAEADEFDGQRLRHKPFK